MKTLLCLVLPLFAVVQLSAQSIRVKNRELPERDIPIEIIASIQTKASELAFVLQNGDTFRYNYRDLHSLVLNKQKNQNITSSNSNLKTSAIVCCPNPFEDVVQVANLLEEPLRGTIDLYSSEGVKVKSYYLDEHGNSVLLNLQNLNSGLYHLVYSTDTNSQTFQIIKQ